jgi:thiol:disulfide interchange protein DsbD
VLPVLAIKVFGITELSRQGRRALRASGLAYTAGVVLSMLALAGVVLSLRAAGTSVGWGFQMQEPRFLAGIGAVLVVFALNLFGAFEIGFAGGPLGGWIASARGARRSFLEGLLAVVLATPCSAPYLGTALGFAFASPAAATLAVFGAIGLGLALPYLAITWMPLWARWLPRPGPWMLRIRELLGFALLGTVVWLLWVARRQVGADGLVLILTFLVGVALCTWAYGRLQGAGRPRAAWSVAALALAGALALGALPALGTRAASAPQSAALPWRPYDPQALRVALAQGRPALVNFTADWCLTCKANEHLVLDTARVRREVERLDVALFRADWTRRDERIRAELARHGRAGVPLYLVYAPQRPLAPDALPELLGVDLVVEALRAAAGASEAARNEAEGGST